MPLGIALRHHSQLPPRPGARSFKGKSHDALDTYLGEEGDLGRNSMVRVLVGCATLAGVLAFAVLAHDYPVQIGRLELARRERRLRALEDAGGSHVDVLVQHFADGEDEAPKGDMIGDI